MVMSLQEFARHSGPIGVQLPFSSQDYRQVKSDPGTFSDDPPKYMDHFLKLTWALHCTWKDVAGAVAGVVGPTLSPEQSTEVLMQLRDLGVTPTSSAPKAPCGSCRSPKCRPALGLSQPRRQAVRHHFLHCLVEGMKKLKENL